MNTTELVEKIVSKTRYTFPLCFDSIDSYHRRSKVYGGWLVKAYVEEFDHTTGRVCSKLAAMTFVPDEFHKWEIN